MGNCILRDGKTQRAVRRLLEIKDVVVKRSYLMEIPKYIEKHIEANNKLLLKAVKHSEIVLDWYNKQLEKLKADNSEIPDEEFSEIKENSLSSGEISLAAIIETLELLEVK